MPGSCARPEYRSGIYGANGLFGYAPPPRSLRGRKEKDFRNRTRLNRPPYFCFAASRLATSSHFCASLVYCSFSAPYVKVYAATALSHHGTDSAQRCCPSHARAMFLHSLPVVSLSFPVASSATGTAFMYCSSARS